MDVILSHSPNDVFLEGNEINIPYLLLNSLRKISGNEHKKIQFIETVVYYHGLIKMLIKFQLKGLRDYWDNFLPRNHFKEEEEEQEEEERNDLFLMQKSRPYRPCLQDESTKYRGEETSTHRAGIGC